MAVQIQIRRGTAAAWTTANPTLAAGEIGYETDTRKLKVGTGAAAWSALSYLSTGGGAVASVNGQTGTVVLNAAAVGADPSGSALAARTQAYTYTDDSIYNLQLGNASTRSVPASGNAGTFEVVVGSDTRLSNARTPTAHSHVLTDLTDMTLFGRNWAQLTGAGDGRAGLGLGTVATLNVPASGNAAAGEVVKGSDTRLTDARTPTTHTHTASQISDSTSAGRALLTAADAAAQRTALALAAIARSVFLSTVADGTVVIEAKAAFACVINQIRGLKTSAGSVSVAIQINGTNVTGLSSLSATTSAQDATATAANTVAAGDRITLVLSSTSSAAGLEFTLSATR